MTTAATPQDGRLTFPRDFPKAPPGGVTLISFKDFKERGIAVEPDPNDDKIELDTLGIPTVQMKEHGTDRCKTKAKRVKKEKEEKQKYLDNNLEVPWWVDWAENEGRRIAKPVNASEPKISKFFSAARDFKTSRRWPLPRNHQTDVSYIWTLLQLYLGLEVAVAKKDRPSRKKVFKEPLEEDEDESSGDEMDVDFIDDSDDDGPTADPQVKKARQFLADPERSIKIFLSSFIRLKGVIWSRINLEQAPHLCIFFLEFLLRSRTLPSLDPGIRSAVDIAKQALIELPLSGIISEIIPDNFSKGCHWCWGEKTQVFRQLEVDQEWLDKLNAAREEQEAAEKREAEEATPELVVPEPEQEMPEEVPGWGAATGHGWGSANEGGGWGSGGSGWGAEDEGAEVEEENTWATDFELSKVSLMTLLGPSVLPLTHTTGVVEKSFRRITNLIPVPTNPLPKSSVAKDAPWFPDPAGVETVLERTFPQIVLSPWLNWDGGEFPGFADPEILPASQGPVVEPPYATKTPEENGPTPKPHDPGNDSITVLVQPAVFEKLVKGMSLAATWINIVRQPLDASVPVPKKKGKKKAPANFWYMEELAGVFPGYWTTKAT